MIDIHSHLIFGVDDGSSNIEESMRMIAEAEKHGIRTIIATPHFQNKIYKNEGVLDNFEILLNKASDYHVDLLLGSEIFADEDIITFIKIKKKINFTNTRHLLIELPYNATLEYSTRLVNNITASNIKPIIAHPERNRKMIRDFAGFIKFIKFTNCRIQIDAGSIAGVYGWYIKEATKQLLKLKVVDFVASNAHSSQDYETLYPHAVSKIHQLCDEEYARKLLDSNANEIISAESTNKYNVI